MNRGPRPGTHAETAFLALGAGAALWLKEAAAQGTSRTRVKMDHAVSIAKLTGAARVDWALGHAAVRQRCGEGDLASILAAHLDPTAPARRAGEQQSLTQGTAGWAALGITNTNTGGAAAASAAAGGSETASSAATVNRRSGQPRRGDQLEAGQRGLSGARYMAHFRPTLFVRLRVSGWVRAGPSGCGGVVRCPAWRNGWRW